MGLRENLSKSVKKGGLSGGEIRPPSRAYERYFAGYVETAEPVPGKKRARSVRTYVDTIWIRDLPAKQVLGLRILFVVLFLLSLALLLFSAGRDIPANYIWFVTLPQACSLFFLGWTALALGRYCTTPAEMTVRQHRLGVLQFHRANALAGIFLLILAAAYLLHTLLYPDHSAGSPTGAFACLLGGCSQLAVFLLERRVPYTSRDNPLAE